MGNRETGIVQAASGFDERWPPIDPLPTFSIRQLCCLPILVSLFPIPGPP